MPLYYFHIHDGQDSPDDEGTELSGPEEARTQAVVTTGAMLKDHGAKFWDHGEWKMVVTDDAGEIVCALRLSAEQRPALVAR